jgi:hypothetical protein
MLLLLPFLHSLSLNDDIEEGNTRSKAVKPLYLSLSLSLPSKTTSSSSSSSSLWPPLKSARYCKKQRNRNGKSRGITPSIMLMHESAINHHRVTTALNELSSSNGTMTSIFDSSQVTSKPFWSKRACQEFWNEYLDCDSTLTHDMSFLSLKSSTLTFTLNGHKGNDENCPQNCYTKISKSIRKLLKRTFTGAPTFSELETLIKSFIRHGVAESELSCGQVLNSSEFGVTIKLDTPFHRVWLHAICQYHGLSSQSKTLNDQRLVHIKTVTAKTPLNPRISLYNFLLDLV